MSNPKSGILEGYVAFFGQKIPKTTFFDAFLDGCAKKLKQNWPQKKAPSPMLLGNCDILTQKLFFNFLAHCEKDACYAFVGKNIYKSYVYVFSYIARYYLNILA